MDVKEILVEAWSEVRAAELPEHMQEVAFREVLQHMLHGSTPASERTTAHIENKNQSTPTGAVWRPVNSPDETEGPKESEIYRRVSEHTGIEESKVEELLYVDNDEIRVVIPGLKLGKNNADRTRAVAQLLTVARGFGLEEEGTLLSTIRAECSRLKVHDSANFSSQISKLPGYVVSGLGSNRRLRIRSGGVQSFVDLANQLVDGNI